MGILKIPWEKIFPVGIFKIPTGFFPHIIKWEFFPTGKIRKNKMRVLSRRSLLKVIHIAEKSLYGSIQKFNFFPWDFFPIFQYGKKIPWDFSIF